MNKDIYYKILQLFKDRGNLYHLGQTDANTNSSFISNELLDLLQGNVDLDGETLDSILDYLNSLQIENEDSQADLWNESLKKLIKDYQESFLTEESDTIDYKNFSEVTGKIIAEKKDNKNATFNIKDIITGDAGRAFEDYDSRPGGKKWVKPWYNIDFAEGLTARQRSYNRVRGKDQVLSILKNRDKLQFTNSYLEDGEIENFLRLLMPLTSRRIAIEDLNRNFWVLSQVVTGITAYLFGDDSPFNKMFGGILNEVVQLWENIEYQWATIALLEQKPCNDIYFDFIPLPNSTIQPYRKFDNFDNFDFNTYYSDSAMNEVIDRIDFYRQKCTKSMIVIIPFIRKNNYQKNYFSRMDVPYLCIYNQLNHGYDKEGFADSTKLSAYYHKGWKIIPILQNEVESLFFTPYKEGVIDLTDRLYSAREDKVHYKYCYPAKITNSQRDDSIYNYYCALRVTPEITSLSFNNKGELLIEGLSFTATDAIENILNNVVPSTTILKTNPINISSTTEYPIIITPTIKKEAAAEYDYTKLIEIKQHKTYYLGELPSFSLQSAPKPNFEFVKDGSLQTDCKLIKIGNFLPYTIAEQGKNNDSTIFQEQINPNGEGTTGYIFNLTPKQEYSSYYPKGIGPGNTHGYTYCKYYIPNDQGTAYERAIVLTSWHGQSIKEVLGRVSGINSGGTVIENYLQLQKQKNPDSIDKIIYFMAAIGINPWHNGSTQGYWENSILTHVFRFIPDRLSNFQPKPPWGQYKRHIANIGTLEMLGLVSKQERAYTFNDKDGNSQYAFEGQSTQSGTWRLPELRPAYDTKYDGYVELKDKHTGDIYFIDIKADEAIKLKYESSKSSNDWDILISFINENYDTYKDNIFSIDTLYKSITSFDCIWCTYDGNTEDNTNNAHNYSKNNKLKEVGYMYFSFESQNMKIPDEDGIVLSGDSSGKKYYAYARAYKNFDEFDKDKIIDGNYILPDYPRLRVGSSGAISNSESLNGTNDGIDADVKNNEYVYWGKHNKQFTPDGKDYQIDLTPEKMIEEYGP